MIQCDQCEHFQRDSYGKVRLKCDPFSNLKEPECLIKWQLLKLDTMVQAYQATVAIYQKLAPMQEKMFRHMEREIDDVEDADQWKHGDDDDDDDGEDDRDY